MKDEKKFIPLNGTVLMKMVDVEKQVKSGDFILSETTSGKTLPEGKVIVADTDIVVNNDEVVFRPIGTYEFILNGEKLLITNKDNLLGKIEQ